MKMDFLRNFKNSLDKIYLKEGEVNFYINEILEKSIENFDKDKDDETKLVENFKTELGEYRGKNGKFVISIFLQYF